MTLRGEYRPIYAIMVDGPDFQRLSADARWVMTVCKISLGAAGIDVLYPEVLARRTGLSSGKVARALAALAAADWLRVDGNLMWLVRGLEFEPTMTPTNGKHRVSIARRLESLPRSPLIEAFRQHYADWFDTLTIASPYPHDSLDIPSREPDEARSRSRSTEPELSPEPDLKTAPASAARAKLVGDSRVENPPPDAMRRFIDAAPHEKQARWRSTLRAWAAGEDWGAPPRPTVEQIQVGLADYLAAGNTDFSPRHVRGFIAQAMASPAAVNGRSAPRGRTALDRTVEASMAIAARHPEAN